jgi:hypothetical protein
MNLSILIPLNEEESLKELYSWIKGTSSITVMKSSFR